MLPFFIFKCFSSTLKPILGEQCSSTQYYDTYRYGCNKLPELVGGLTLENNSLVCKNGFAIDVSTDKIGCIDKTGLNQDNLVYFNNETYYYINPTHLQLNNDTFNLNGIYEQVHNVKLNETYQKLLNDSIKICSSNKNSLNQACQVLASSCVLAHYDPNSPFCTIFNEGVFAEKGQSLYDYEFWKEDLPFIEYGTSRRALIEDVLTNKFEFNQIIEIQLARYSKEGKFLGFTKMKDQFKVCSDKRDINQVWRIYGSNINDQCYFNIKKLLENEEADFIEPFLVENIKGNKVLRPIPVFDYNYVNSEGEYANQGSSMRNKRVFRRFFLFDNYMTNDYYQYLSNITLAYQTAEGYIPLPYFVVRYEIIKKSEVNNAEFDVFNQLESKVMRLFTFKTSYSINLDDFWFNALVVIVVLSSLLLVLYIYRLYVNYQHFAQDGFNFIFVVQCIHELCRLISFYSTVTFFIFSLDVLVKYKWSNSVDMLLPDDNVFELLHIFLWISFTTSCIAILTKLIMFYNYEVIFIEWKPIKVNGKNEVFRKVQIAHEWVKLFRKREYSITFILAFIVFLLNGLDLDYVATPIQSNELINTGIISPILRVPFLCIIWIASFVVQVAFFKIVNLILGSPIDKFLDICGSAHISVLLMMSRSWGFYINGKPVTGIEEDSMDSIDNNQEDLDAEIPRYRIPGQPKESIFTDVGNYESTITDFTEDGLFELHLSPHFRDKFVKLYDNINNFVKTTNNVTAADPKTVIEAAMANFTEMNTFLKRFFGAKPGSRDFILSKEPLTSIIIGMPPTVELKSVFYIEKKYNFSKALMLNAQWMVAIFEMLLFICVDYEVHSSVIAAFTTLIFDFIFNIVVRMIGNAIIKRSSLYDKRFYF